MNTETSNPTIPEILSNYILDEKYRIIKELSSGGMGSVYVAEQLSLQREVAIKVILPSFGSTEGAQERFFQEASVSSKFEHPNIVRVFDFGKTKEGLLYLVMELLSGLNLKQYILKNGALSEFNCVELGLQLSGALAEIHSKGIIHRDIKPSNIFVLNTPGERVEIKLIDFGLGKETTGDTDITKTGQVLGSPMYMAPEQVDAHADAIDARSDIYSLGLTMYYALTGKKPYDTQEVSKTLIAQLVHNPKPAFEVRDDISEDSTLVKILHTCYEKKRDMRFPNGLELNNAFQVCRHNLTSDTSISLDLSNFQPPPSTEDSLLLEQTTDTNRTLNLSRITSEDLVTLEEPKPKNPYGLLTFLAICIFGAILIFMNQKDQSIQVEIKSIPTDANVYFDNKLLGSTPLVYVTESERELRIEKQGFETQTLTISPRIPQTTIKLIPLPKPKAPTQEKETVSPKEEPPKTEPKTKTKTVTKTKSNRRKPPQNKELIDPWE